MYDSTLGTSAITPRASEQPLQPRDMLEVSLTESESGPTVILVGEADLTSLGRLNSALDAKIEAGTRLLTVDVSGLRFADSASVAALALAARTLRDRGGQLELLGPQPAVARILSLTGVDQFMAIRG